jgi:outer membrane protein
MKKLLFSMLALAAPLVAGTDPVKVGIVNFKICVEQSKLGKKEQTQFESMKKQMEQVMGEKEKELNALGAKINDPDYRDSLSKDAEAELMHKARALNQEMGALQNQYYQALNQAQYKVMQKVHDEAAKASGLVAKQKGLLMVLGEENGFYFDKTLDISNEVIVEMDKAFEKENNVKTS